MRLEISKRLAGFDMQPMKSELAVVRDRLVNFLTRLHAHANFFENFPLNRLLVSLTRLNFAARKTPPPGCARQRQPAANHQKLPSSVAQYRDNAMLFWIERL